MERREKLNKDDPGVYIASDDIRVFKKINCLMFDERHKTEEEGYCVAELLIQKGAVVVTTKQNTFRASAAKVMRLWPNTVYVESERWRYILNRENRKYYTVTKGWSEHDSDFLYKEGEVAIPDKLDTNIKKECSNGLYFLLTREEAERQWGDDDA